MISLFDFFKDKQDIEKTVNSENNEVFKKIILELTKLSLIIPGNGLLIIENKTDILKDFVSANIHNYYNKLLYFVVNGFDSPFIETVAKNYIASSCISNKEILMAIIITNGLLSISSIDNPISTYELLSSYVGIGALPYFEEIEKDLSDKVCKN